MSTSVRVANISPLLDASHLRELFECCGTIQSLTWDNSSAQKVCIIGFGDPQQAQAATFLSGTPLGDRQLEVTAYSGGAPTSVHIAAPGFPPPPVMGQQIQIPVVGQQQRMPEVTIRPAPGAPTVDQQALLRASREHEELVAKTVYVGGLSLSVTEEHLKHFFSTCGTILFVKMAGRQPPARFAFIEFASKQAAATALTLSGAILLDCSVKIGKATNPIIKPKEKTDTNKLEEIMRKVRANIGKIDKKVKPRSRSRSRERRRSRSRSRDRSRRNRSRDRGRRRRSRSRDRDRSRRNRSRSPQQPLRRKRHNPHEGMFFDGYTWQPIAQPGVVQPGVMPPAQ